MLGNMNVFYGRTGNNFYFLVFWPRISATNGMTNERR